jgi:hypothetical protein
MATKSTHTLVGILLAGDVISVYFGMANNYFTFFASSSILPLHYLSPYNQTLYALSHPALCPPRMQRDFILTNLAETTS